MQLPPIYVYQSMSVRGGRHISPNTLEEAMFLDIFRSFHTEPLLVVRVQQLFDQVRCFGGYLIAVLNVT